jgi:DHA3 family tetracycline resistance protein-like MFS transporter
VIIGIFILGAAWLLEGTVPAFIAILVAEAIRAAGEAFLSGATQAWLAGEVGEEEVGPIFIRSSQINRVAHIVATLGIMALASWRLNMPVIIAGGLCLLLGIFLIIFMSERGFKPLRPEERKHWQAMLATFRQGTRVVRACTVLMVILLISVVWGISSEGYDRLWEAFLLKNFTFPSLGNLEPVVWFGIISISGNLLSLAVTEVNRRRLEGISRNSISTARWLSVLSGLSVITSLGLALSGNILLAFILVITRGLVGSISAPLYDAYLIQHIRPEVRATVISMIGQVNATGQIVGGPAVGAVAKLASIRLALMVSAILYLPVPFLYGWVLRRDKNRSIVAAGATNRTHT